ncbi:MAG: hypothetical protein ACR2GK_05430 [Gemmatimonadaceae bacterium]|jgi:hypothetical protein
MSIPLLIGLLMMVVIVAGAAGLWRARTRGATTVQSSIMALMLVVIAGVLVYMVLSGSF